MKEVWAEIKGYEGIYLVSNLGGIKSLDKRVNCGHGTRVFPGRTRKPNIGPDGYARVGLRNGEGQLKMKLVHRLVAETFMPNPNNLPEVNHKNENKANNSVENLEWCTRAYNNTYANKAVLQTKKKDFKVIGEKIKKTFASRKFNGINQLTADGVLVAWWVSIREAERRTGISKHAIGKCCRGNMKMTGGYVWQFADLELLGRDMSKHGEATKNR